MAIGAAPIRSNERAAMSNAVSQNEAGNVSKMEEAVQEDPSFHSLLLNPN